MDGIPTFCIVDERKQFVPLRVQGATGAVYNINQGRSPLCLGLPLSDTALSHTQALRRTAASRGSSRSRRRTRWRRRDVVEM